MIAPARDVFDTDHPRFSRLHLLSSTLEGETINGDLSTATFGAWPPARAF
jgi:hypothetical protein